MVVTACIVAAVVAGAGAFVWLLVFLAHDEKIDRDTNGDCSVYP